MRGAIDVVVMSWTIAAREDDGLRHRIPVSAAPRSGAALTKVRRNSATRNSGATTEYADPIGEGRAVTRSPEATRYQPVYRHH